MNVRPFCLVTGTARREIELKCQEALGSWASRWLPDGSARPALRVDVHTGEAPAPEEELGYLLQDAKQGFIWAPAAALPLLSRLLFDAQEQSRQPHGLLNEVAQAALEAMLKAFMPHVGADAPVLLRALPDGHAKPGGGLLDQVIDTTAGRLVLIRGAEPKGPAKSTVPARPRQGVLQALDAQTVTLRAELGHIDMDIQSLCALAVGDVIRLDTKLDDPIRLRVDGHLEHMAVNAYLGTLDGHRAIEVVSSAPAP
jgi:flagellar motor switch/type III secretory pathway protein FliN